MDAINGLRLVFFMGIGLHIRYDLSATMNRSATESHAA
jgi:hypothetical protein